MDDISKMPRILPFAVDAMDSIATDYKYNRTLLKRLYFSFLITSTHTLKKSDPFYVNLALQTFVLVYSIHVLDVLKVPLGAKTW